MSCWFQGFFYPRDPITLSDDDWGVQSPPKRKVFRFYETILSFGEPGSLGLVFQIPAQKVIWVAFGGANSLKYKVFRSLEVALLKSYMDFFLWRAIIEISVIVFRKDQLTK